MASSVKPSEEYPYCSPDELDDATVIEGYTKVVNVPLQSDIESSKFLEKRSPLVALFSAPLINFLELSP